jgi:ATP-dependent DNA helicase DinG
LSLAARIGEAFDAGGLLERSLEGFRPREGQRRMAEAVAAALAARSILAVEAGTGTGKTYAYLAPVLDAGLKVIVSTGTKTLQDQLFQRDLPALCGALGRPVHVALLKGRANYLCRHRLGLALEEGPGAVRESRRLAKIQAWAATTTRGEIAEVPGIPEDAPIWGRVTSNADNCLGQECGEFQRCHVVKARREALKAEVVVVNHHLLLADLALKEEGFGELLPGADAVVVDEAHQLPEIAARFFGVSVGTRQGPRAGRRCARRSAQGGRLAAALRGGRRWAGARRARDSGGDGRRRRADFLARTAGRGRSGARDAGGGRRGPRPRPATRWAAPARASTPSSAVPAPAPRAWPLSARATQASSCAGPRPARATPACTRRRPTPVAPWRRRSPAATAAGCSPRRRSRWATISAPSWTGSVSAATQIPARPALRRRPNPGLDPTIETLRLDSPFDFRGRTRLYVPQGLPPPSDPDYTRRVVEVAVPLLEASGGRAFLLFTSHRALQTAARLLRPRAEALGFPVLVQGDEPRARLLASFRRLGNAVLLGTQSFWEGVDVKGPALSVVLIDKLPFAAPDDPLLKARLEAAREAGREPFRDVQLPQAVLSLKQGIGRLIRDTDDAGLAAVCDPRLLGKGYGRVFLASLPPMPLVRDEDAAVDFLLGLGLTALENAG